MTVLIIIGILAFGFCIAGFKFFERLLGLIFGGILGLVILGIIVLKVIGVF